MKYRVIVKYVPIGKKVYQEICSSVVPADSAFLALVKFGESHPEIQGDRIVHIEVEII